MKLKIAFLTAALAAAASGQMSVTPSLPESEWTRKFWLPRFDATRAEAAKGGYDIVFLGDSITHNWEGAGAGVWKERFANAPYRALNCGFSGDRTEHVLWRLEHGQLAGLKPKAIVLMIGTNNTGHRNREAESPLDTILGIRAILAKLEKDNRESKVILTAIFPRGAETNTPERVRNDAVNSAIKTFADGKRVFWCDLNSLFLTLDGRLEKTVAADLLHPGPDGYRIWADALKPYLDYALGLSDVRPQSAPPALTALPPATPAAAQPAYRDAWMKEFDANGRKGIPTLRAEECAHASRYYDIVFLGDGILQGWHDKGTKRETFDAAFGGLSTLNLGFGGDRTEHVLWNLEYGGFLDGVQVRLVTLLIGTNNASWSHDPPEDIVHGIEKIVALARKKQPQAKIALVALLPREAAHVRNGKNFAQKGQEHLSDVIKEVNARLAKLADGQNVVWVDLTEKFTTPEGLADLALLPDGTHPSPKGYAIIAEAILPLWGSAAPQAKPRPPVLVPAPRKIDVSDGEYVAAAPEGIRPLVRFSTDAALKKEGYRIRISEKGIDVSSPDAAGAFYAVQTLEQLAEKRKGGHLAFPFCEIEDWPEYAWRGFHFDDCRHFFGKEVLKRTIDLMAAHKFNRLHWHLTEDQGWRIDVPGHPELVQYGAVRPRSPAIGAKPEWTLSPEERKRQNPYNTEQYGPYFYTESDLREIVDYAKERFVTVVPEIELPGHVYCALAAYPELACRPENLKARTPRTKWGIERDVLCLGNDEGIRLFEKVLDYVCTVFPSDVIHIGGDECPNERWRECPKCQARAKALALKSTDDLQSWVTRHFADYLAQKGRRIVGWDEILAGDVPQSAIGMCWRMNSRGGAGHHLVTAEEATAKGHDLVVCRNEFCYLDYAQGLENDPYQYIGGNLPLEKAYAFDPMEGIPAERRAHVLGGQCCNWSEYTWTRFDLDWKMFPRSCAIAEALWTAPAERDFAGFLKRMETHRRRLLAKGVNCAPLGN